jgi:hypothetical protein
MMPVAELGFTVQTLAGEAKIPSGSADGHVRLYRGAPASLRPLPGLRRRQTNPTQANCTAMTEKAAPKPPRWPTSGMKRSGQQAEAMKAKRLEAEVMLLTRCVGTMGAQFRDVQPLQPIVVAARPGPR